MQYIIYNTIKLFKYVFICFADAVKLFQFQTHFPSYLQDPGILLQVTFKIQAFSYKLLSRSRHFLTSYFQDPGIFLQVTFKIQALSSSNF